MKKITSSSSAKLPANKSRGPDFDETSNKNPVEERTNKTPVKSTISKSKKSGFNESDDEGKQFSNNFDYMFKLRELCKICQSKTRNLSTHVAHVHLFSFEDYRQKYGAGDAVNPNPVYHRCGVCEKEMVFDYSTVSLHVKNIHGLPFQHYKEIKI